jgi:hypothetical protein
MARTSSYLTPPGFRDSPQPPVVQGEVLASTYSIRAEIARTDTGLVYEARDMLMDRLVAFKLAWRDPGMPSLLGEARRCAAVRDPCAVAIHAIGRHHGMEYVVGERVTGRLLRELLGVASTTERYLAMLRQLVAAVTRAHEAGIAVGDISGATVLVGDEDRMVLGRLSLSQVPAFGPLGQILAPEVVRGEVEALDPTAAEAIDLYGLGCIAIELARGTPPFADRAESDREAELRGHAYEKPPRLIDLAPEVPGELSDLVEWLLAKQPHARPRSAKDALAQIDAIEGRLGAGKARPIRVLVVADDTARARWLWSLARRAHASANVDIASEGTDAAYKLNRDVPELVLVDARLKGVMNALELCMYARGLEADPPQLVVIGEIPDKERSTFATAGVHLVADGPRLADAILDRVRATTASGPRRRKRITVSG